MISIPKKAFFGLEFLRIEVENAKNRYEYSVWMNGYNHKKTKQYLEQYDRLDNSYNWILNKIIS